MNKIYKIGFVIIIIILIPILYIFNLLYNGEKDINYLENRRNNKLVDLKNTNFIDSSFQKQFDNSLIDQFPLVEEIKSIYVNVINYNKPFRFVASLISGQNVRYEIKDEIFTMGDDNYLMWNEYGVDLFYLNTKNIISYINDEIDNVEKYLYLINDSKTLEDGKGGSNNQYYEMLKKELNDVKVSQLNINNINDYKYYFYKSDHHWNLYGSYEGYKDIVNLLGVNESVIIPNERIKIGEDYCGSFCKLIGYNDSREPFYIYDYNYSDMNIYINGELSNYGHEYDYLYKGWELKPNENYYGAVYGGNYGEVVFSTGNEDKDNLLVISSSFINPISKLIAAHFNKTHIVDVRYYNDDNDDSFDISNYIKENNIDKVIFVGDVDTLVTINKWIEDNK